MMLFSEGANLCNLLQPIYMEGKKLMLLSRGHYFWAAGYLMDFNGKSKVRELFHITLTLGYLNLSLLYNTINIIVKWQVIQSRNCVQDKLFTVGGIFNIYNDPHTKQNLLLVLINHLSHSKSDQHHFSNKILRDHQSQRRAGIMISVLDLWFKKMESKPWSELLHCALDKALTLSLYV